jgi:hypothetical protein
MTEKEIQLLRFEKNSSLDDYDPFYYYTYDITNGLSFISCADNEVKDGEWYIEFFNTEIPIRFYKFEEVQSLINLLTKRIVK